MTMKEKADSYIEKVSQQSLGSPINALSRGYEDGYKDGMEEAFRWRDVREEPGNEINWADAGAFFLEGYNEAVKDAYNQGLQDAANNVKVLDDPWHCGSCSIDKDSILKLKK